MAWFSLTGPNASHPDSYTLQGSQPTCPGTERICAIQANADGNNKPIITTALYAEMVDALDTQTPSANVKLKDRA
ncbi:hypothetical protein [Sphingobacterium athyrii]|uniref:Uncharacterized protein n=1 Tax=Sphingobacterium athyrii TaxID=2152717 RepID=A0A363NUV5_9SPHI|nr:hypothetical protein [Sphingobacterium athyrii]PUV24574.1 hypothetical protein DCO56_14630 [Sphingobacterium athyrii]